MAIFLYQVRLTQLYYGQTLSNNWYFFDELTGEENAQFEIASIFMSRHLPAINDVQNERVINQSLYVLNVTQGTDSYSVGLTGGGTGVIDPSNDLPPFLTAGIRWNVSPSQFRPEGLPIKAGYTRLSGLLDANIINGIAFSSAYVSGLTSVVDEFVDPIATVDGTYQFVINRRPGVSEVDPEQQIAQVVGYSSFKVGTQNTRK